MVRAGTGAFQDWLAAVGPLVEESLRRTLAGSSWGEAPPALRQAVADGFLSGGKRVRPALVLLACGAHGGERQRALPAAVAVEMVHAYSLVHDDLPAMDDDDLRRGRPTVHVAHGEALAILAGDALQALAFEVLAAQEDAALARDQAAILARAAGPAGMVGGQALDLAAEGRPCALGEVRAIHAAKTGALLAAALHLGARAAGAAPALWEAEDSPWRRYAGAVGSLFQATDDLLDATATTAALGKTAGKDEAVGKATLVRAAGLDGAREIARRLVGEARAALEAMPALGERDALADLPRFLLDRCR